MKNLLIASIALLLLSGSTLQYRTSTRPEKLVWADEFNYTGTPDATKWNYDLGDGCPKLCGWGNEDMQYYTNDANNVRVENGKLIIEARKEERGGKPYTSARMISKGKGDWLYGRIEVKAKLPKGRGTWPAIWMLSSDKKYAGWPTSGEIDIMEHVGYDQGVIHGTLHSEKYNHKKGTQQEGIITIPDCSDEFHVYILQWTQNQIDIFVDDKLCQSVSRKADEDFRGWPFDQRFHLILNVAVGGLWGGRQGVDETIWPQRMEVDYVRVYQ